MNSILSYLEIGLIGFIIVKQFQSYINTKREIENFQSLLPTIDTVSIKALPIGENFLNQNNLENVLVAYQNFNSSYDEIQLEDGESLIHLNLVSPYTLFTEGFEKIKLPLNKYLYNNKGSIADYALIKDIVERNIDAKDDHISQTISRPLYLGLMGTMLGIIFGLINLFIIHGEGADVFDKGISSFLLSVAIAMIASFVGLYFTVSNSTINFKNARKIIDTNKNDFYTLIQTELMPLVNQNVSNSVHTLKNVLVRFNQDFSSKLNHLDKVFTKNFKAVEDQAAILKHLEEIDINSFAKANINILIELQKSMDGLERFNHSINASNKVIHYSTELMAKIHDVLNRTNHVEEVFDKVATSVDESRKVMRFIDVHLKKYEDNDKLVLDWIRNADDVMKRTSNEFKTYVEEQRNSIKIMTAKEGDLLERAYQENQPVFGYLKLLEDVKKSNEDLVKSSQQVADIKDEMVRLKEVMNSSLKLHNRTADSLENTEKLIASIPSKLKINFFKNPFKKKTD